MVGEDGDVGESGGVGVDGAVGVGDAGSDRVALGSAAGDPGSASPTSGKRIPLTSKMMGAFGSLSTGTVTLLLNGTWGWGTAIAVPALPTATILAKSVILSTGIFPATFTSVLRSVVCLDL